MKRNTYKKDKQELRKEIEKWKVPNKGKKQEGKSGEKSIKGTQVAPQPATPAGEIQIWPTYLARKIWQKIERLQKCEQIVIVTVINYQKARMRVFFRAPEICMICKLV